MSKAKTFLKRGKGRKNHQEQLPETADEFLAAAVEQEEAGEKWRAGDAAKSMRFFSRAIDTYRRGLSRYPRNFDLAYNLARIQYEIATHPILVAQIHQPIIEVLAEALDSHQYALNLENGNADAMFNTAQVMTSIAEECAKDEQRPDADALRYLDEAIDMFQKCYLTQESQYKQFQEQLAISHARTAEDAQMNDSQHQSQPSNAVREATAPASLVSEQEQWVAIEEPVDVSTLLDTALAQLATLTTYCSLLSNPSVTVLSKSLPWFESFYFTTLHERFEQFRHNSLTSRRQPEIALSIARFFAVFTEARFRHGLTDMHTYKNDLDKVFTFRDAAKTSYEMYQSHADAQQSFNSAVAEASPDPFNVSLQLRWQALSSALALRTKASQTPDIPAEEIPGTHSQRGDISLLQFQLSRPPWEYAPAFKHAATLLNNAKTFYANAEKLTMEENERRKAGAKRAVVQVLQGETLSGNENLKDIAEALEEMVEEDLLLDQDRELIPRTLSG